MPLTIAAFALAQAACWGMTFNLPAITGPAMAEDLHLPYPAVMAGPTVMLVLMALAAMPFLRLFERLGSRLVMTASVGLGALGVLVVGTAPTAWAFFAGWMLVGIAGTGMLTTAMQIGLAELAGTQAKDAIGALLIFGGLSTTICWPLLGAMQSAFGWRLATVLGGGLMLIVAAPVYWLLLSRQPISAMRKTDASPAPPIDRVALALLAFSTAANGFVTWGFSLTIITLFEGRGLDHGTAVLVGSFIGLAAFSARLINFVGGRRLSGLGTGLIASLGLPLSFLLLILGSGIPAAVVFVIAYGVSSGAMAVARATMALDLFPATAYARASSALALPLNLSFAFAPPAFAFVLTSHGSDVALLISLCLSLLALAALTTLILRHRLRAAP